MPVLPKFILTKFTLKSETVGVYNTLEDAKKMKSSMRMLGEVGVDYSIFEVVNESQ